MYSKLKIFFCVLPAPVGEEDIYFKNTSSSLGPGKIVGGANVDIKNVPYQVSVNVKNEHECGGSLITKRHILTAAHCVEE